MLAFLLARTAAAAAPHHRALSAVAATTTTPQNSITDYLLSSPYSIPPSLVSKLTPRLAHLKSPLKPQTVLTFLDSQGFSPSNIHKLISWNPRLLCSNPPKSLAPKFHSLSQLQFTPSEIVEIIMSNPCVLNRNFDKTILPKLLLWTHLLGSRQAVLQLFKRKQWFLTYNVENHMLPNLEILRSHGVANDRIAILLRIRPRFIYQNTDSLKTLIDRAETYGVSRDAGIFIWALDALYRNSKANFKAKMGVMRSMGWSEDEFFAAFRKAPLLLSNSAALLQRKMEFLVGEGGCEAGNVAEQPFLLTVSLENRLVPRCEVMRVLRERGVNTNRYKLTSIVAMTNKMFLEKFVSPYVEKIPEIHDVFVSRSDGAEVCTA